MPPLDYDAPKPPPAILRSDACPYQVLIVCQGCTRIAHTDPAAAWLLAARHALDVHADRAAYQAAHKYARQHRDRKARRP